MTSVKPRLLLYKQCISHVDCTLVHSMCIDCDDETSGTDCTECASGWGVTTAGDCIRTF